MLLQKQSNRWSCLPTAFAMVLGRPVASIIEATGHDGSEELWPKKKRAWHIQEMIRVCFDLGFSVTEFLTQAESSPGPGYDCVKLDFDISSYLKYSGVLGAGSHAYAFQCSRFFDPSTGLETKLVLGIHTIWVIESKKSC